MSYAIQSKNDLLTGATLTVKIPESDLDRKALRTIQADRPEFILPFHFRCVEGEIEFVYQIGSHNKLQYLTGNRSPTEYAEFWSSALNPLLDCGDWFMKPYSFILSAEFLYYDKSKKTICYVYIPSIHDCSEYDDLKEMAAEVSKQIPVSDMVMENKVLRAIMKNFNPQDFLQMLKAYMSPPTPVSEREVPFTRDFGIAPFYPNPNTHAPAGRDVVIPPVRDREKEQGSSGDIIIDIPEKGALKKKKKKAKENKKSPENPSAKKEKATKEKTTFKGVGSLISRLKSARQKTPQQPAPSVQTEREPDHPAAAVQKSPAVFSDVTQNAPIMAAGARFSYVGRAPLPLVIDVRIAAGEVFTIGRYDAAVGRQQSNFEFEKNTKAVSRRHAAIERDEGGYSIIDLASSAGTFVGGQKIPPNTLCRLEKDTRVSFGNSGADYIWEEH